MSEGAAAALVGARVQRIDGPRPDLFLLTLHRADLHGCLVLSTTEGRAGVGWIAERPRGAPASSFVRLLRKHLENGRVVAARADRTGAEIAIRRGDDVARLRLDVRPPNLSLVLEDRIAAALHPSGLVGRAYAPLPDAPDLDAGALEAEGARLVQGAAESARRQRAQALEVTIARRVRQLQRRLRAIEGDLARVDEVPRLRERASLLLASLGAIPSGAREAVVTDWSADPPAPIRIPIDPTRGPKGEAEALFRRARKLERGAELALGRHAETERDLEALARLAASLASVDERELDRIEREAARLGARSQRAGSAAEAAARRPYRTFRGSGDRSILVGRSAADNDALTVRVARPHDHWLHVRDRSGSHVIVPLGRSEACPPELLIDAAHLAAHFSDARDEPIVEVQHVARRHVRKPRGFPPGAVAVTREKVLALRVEPDRLARLLGSEDHG